MGMLKEGVRLDRVRGGRQKYRRNPNVPPYQLQMPPSNPLTPVQSLEDIKLLETLASFEPEPLSVGNCGIDLQHRTSIDSRHSDSRMGIDAQELLSVLSDLYDKELVGVIGWAKQIPGKWYSPSRKHWKFSNLLVIFRFHRPTAEWSNATPSSELGRNFDPYGSATVNAIHGTVVLCIWFLAWWEVGEGVWSNWFIQSRKSCFTSFETISEPSFFQFVHVTQRLERCSPSKEEYYLLKALALSNCDIRLDNYAALKKLRDSILNALNDCVLIVR